MSDPWDDGKVNPVHLSECEDAACGRCQYLIDGLYMACDQCGHWGQQESDGWTLCQGMVFCDKRCADAYMGCDSSKLSETEPAHS